MRRWFGLGAVLLVASACGDDSTDNPVPSGDAGAAADAFTPSDSSSGTDATFVDEGGPPPPCNAPAAFGTSTEVGSFSAGVWTPGRDKDGLVNAKSWDSTPKNQWFQVAGTHLDALEAEVKKQIPNWYDPGTEKWGGVTDDWNGLTIDGLGNRVWLMNAGGHAGSANNGIYEYNAWRMGWGIEKLPSDPTPWSAGYKSKGPNGGTYSDCDESQTKYTDAKSKGTWSPVNDWWGDELFWDRTPTSRHTYSATVYNPNGNELIQLSRGRRLWRYSICDKKYTYKRVLNDGATAGFSGAQSYVVLDETKNELFYGAAGDGLYDTIGYDLTKNAWTNWGSPWSIYSGADARNGSEVTFVSFIANGQPAHYFKYDVATRSMKTSGVIQLSGVSESSLAPLAWYYDGASLAYVPPLDVYWMWTQMADGSMKMFTIDPKTQPWTMKAATATGSIPVPHANAMRKMVWMPRIGAVLMVTRSDQNVFLYRF